MTTKERSAEMRLAEQLKADGLRCNCDLDNWEPQPSTGHSEVCRIHLAVKAAVRKGTIHAKLVKP